LRRLDNRILAAKVVGYLLPISELLGSPVGMVLCPFHTDSQPSAKIYREDEDGIERLFCYSCVEGESLIETDKGFLPLKEVVSRAGEGERVMVRTPRGMDEVEMGRGTGRKKGLKIVFEDGSLIILTGEHKILVGSNSNFYVSSASLLTKDLTLLSDCDTVAESPLLYI
jgi:hypothetical protein